MFLETISDATHMYDLAMLHNSNVYYDLSSFFFACWLFILGMSLTVMYIPFQQR